MQVRLWSKFLDHILVLISLYGCCAGSFMVQVFGPHFALDFIVWFEKVQLVFLCNKASLSGAKFDPHKWGLVAQTIQ